MDLNERIDKLGPERRRLLERWLKRSAGAGATDAKVALGGDVPRCTLSLMFFASRPDPTDLYRPVLDCARLADRAGLEAIWLPERHFVDFGGQFPSPAVLCAALATATERIALRAGSVVVPLDDPLRIVEQWSMVDHLSNGRVGLSCAAGWHPNDFALAPESFADRRSRLEHGVLTLQRLWRGESMPRRNGLGAVIDVRPRPAPRQPALPLWITAVTPPTFDLAGRLGTNVLTGIMGMDLAELASRITAYRLAWRAAGHQGEGRVTLMQHTHLGECDEAAREVSLPYLKSYLASFVEQSREELARDQLIGRLVTESVPEERDAYIAAIAEGYLADRAMIGTERSCMAQLGRLSLIGVDEVACLVDFGPPVDQMLSSVVRLGALAARLDAARFEQAEPQA